MTLSVTSIVAGVPTPVTVGGASLAEHTGTPIVFLHSGTAGCTGAVSALALFKHYGGVPANGTITVTLSDPGAYKMCLAKVANPTFDSAFSFLAGIELNVLPSLETSDPSLSHTANARDTDPFPTLMVALLTGVACMLLIFCWQSIWGRTRRRSLVLAEAPLSTLPVISQTLPSSGGYDMRPLPGLSSESLRQGIEMQMVVMGVALEEATPVEATPVVSSSPQRKV